MLIIVWLFAMMNVRRDETATLRRKVAAFQHLTELNALIVGLRTEKFTYHATAACVQRNGNRVMRVCKQKTDEKWQLRNLRVDFEQYC